jgi:hypothetical protein
MMKKAFFILIMFVLLIPSTKKVRACDSCLIHEADSQVTYDCLTGRYWYYDLVRFTNMTYDEQIAEIRTIRVEAFPGRWHMATYEEMAELWTHSAEAIFSAFAHTRHDEDVQTFYTLGRYDEERDAQRHYFAYVGLAADGQSYEKTELNNLDSIEDALRSGVLGAWVVYEDGSTQGPTVGAGKILPAIMLLLSDPDGSGGPANTFQERGEGVPRR